MVGGGGMMMARRAVPPSLWSGTERLRVRERLQASLAGILELELLRDRQSATVERALEERSSPKDGGDDGRRQPQVSQAGGWGRHKQVSPALGGPPDAGILAHFEWDGRGGEDNA